MDYFAGLDVSVKETSLCIVDDTGGIVREARLASEPEALLVALMNRAHRFKPDWIGSRTAVAVALQRSRRSGSDLC